MSRLPAHLAHLIQPTTVPDLAAAQPEADCTWAYCWPAGVRLSAELPDLVVCAGRVIADLGCGRGHGGLSALVAGAARVAFADGDPEVVRWVEGVLTANGFSRRAQAHVHRWGGAIPGAPYDVVFGGDILYRPECFADLLASIAASLAPDGVALLSDPRLRLDRELPELAATAGLSWTCERRDAGYTLVRIRRTRASLSAGGD